MAETSFVEENRMEVEIDDVSYTQVESQFVNTDPFKKIDISKQSPKMKRRHQRLQKAAPGKPNKGIGDAKSRYVDPDAIDGYALYDVIEPPHDLNILADLYEANTTHFADRKSTRLNSSHKPTSYAVFCLKKKIKKKLKK